MGGSGYLRLANYIVFHVMLASERGTLGVGIPTQLPNVGGINQFLGVAFCKNSKLIEIIKLRVF